MYIIVNYLHHRELRYISVDMVINLLPEILNYITINGKLDGVHNVLWV